MSFTFDREELREFRARAEAAAEHLQLPFRQDLWKGRSGNWLGAGIGSSIDFQDHRPYLPGDDPRYINWQAYARTGAYSMKLYREEVSPVVDLVIDLSASMSVVREKAIRTLELFYYCITSSLHTTASLTCYCVNGEDFQPLSLEAIHGHSWLPENLGIPHKKPPSLNRVKWRNRSMRILISDLLFPGSPQEILSTMLAGHARGMIFCPWDLSEMEPDWFGNVELVDCETNEKRVRYFSDASLRRYNESYNEHFNLWQTTCRQHGLHLCRVPSHGDLITSLSGEAISSGVVELWT